MRRAALFVFLLIACGQATPVDYLSIAQAAAPVIERAGLPAGAWSATKDGGTLSLTMPLGMARSKGEFVTQSKGSMEGVARALFAADPALTRINLTGTAPDGANKEEMPAVTLMASRGTPFLWGVATRYQ